MSKRGVTRPHGISLTFGRAVPEGSIEVADGVLNGMDFQGGEGECNGATFYSTHRSSRLAARITGGPRCLVTIQTEATGFSFWLGDVVHGPIVIPDLEIAVSEGEDRRSFSEILMATHRGHALTALRQIDAEDEESFESAARRTRSLPVPTWLGLSRDMRIFATGLRGVGAGSARERVWDWIQPQWAGVEVPLPDAGGVPVRYQFMVGRGVGSSSSISRRLLDGVLPVLLAVIQDGEIRYDLTSFATLENHELTADANRGTHYLVASAHSLGVHTFDDEQKATFEELLTAERDRAEEVVLCMRVRATNVGSVPRYAWWKTPTPATADKFSPGIPDYEFDEATGFGRYSDDRVFCANRIDGRPLDTEETAILLSPGESVIFDAFLPHRPISAARAAAVRDRDFEQALRSCKEYWEKKQGGASATIGIPEQRLENMVAAGVNHLDLMLLGHEPDGTLAPMVGVYSPIGSESAPIIQFFDSMGHHDIAERSLDYFLDKQRASGLMANFGGYTLETEATLWTLGEHYRYTRDHNWARRVAPNVARACDYVIRRRDERRAAVADRGYGRGYGLLAGKTADPEDPYESFMLNGYAYLGLARAAEMLEDVDESKSREVAREAAALREDLRSAFFQTVVGSPVVPLGDGTWCRTSPPWTGHRGPLLLHASSDNVVTHGAATVRDSLLGPLWLAFQEVLDTEEEATGWLLDYHAELLHIDNTAFSQPYYSPHPWIHLMRGETKRFLKAYYTMVSGLADRETYSFWEHFFHVSPHKTHEEAWFLMQTRWMLYMERKNVLRLLPGVPRAWFTNSKGIALDGVRTYFGPMSLMVKPDPPGKRIDISFTCSSSRRPELIRIRVPDPRGRRAANVSTGEYDPATETITIDGAPGAFELTVSY